MLTLFSTICLGLLLPAIAEYDLGAYEVEALDLESDSSNMTSSADTEKPKKPPQVPTFQIDLDEEPRQRWTHVVKFFAERGVTKAMSKQAVWTEISKAMVDAVMPHLDEEYLEEMQGIADAFGSPTLTLRHLVWRHLEYELGIRTGFECSGIVAAGEHGRVVHGRNLDLDKRLGFLRDLTINVEFTRNGSVLFSGPTFFSLVGLHTAIKPGYWSYQQNTRFQSTMGNDSLLVHNRSHPPWSEASLKAAAMGGKPFFFQARKLMEGNYSFLQAVANFSQTPFMAPHYFILAGAHPYEGAVISVDRLRPGKEAFADVQLLSASTGHWFLVETNDDHWGKPLDGRRAAAEKMTKATKKISPSSVMRTLRTVPVCNPGTIFSWVTVPSSGTMTTNISKRCYHKQPK